MAGSMFGVHSVWHTEYTPNPGERNIIRQQQFATTIHDWVIMGQTFRNGLTLTVILAVACARPSTSPSPSTMPPALVLGDFQDDYGNRFSITPQDWFHQPRTRYRIVRWNPEAKYAIAQNDSTNRGQPNRWTRIDWMVLPGMPPWEWAFCLTAYDAPTADAAEATPPPHRDTPKTGCNGFPFSRMRRI